MLKKWKFKQNISLNKTGLDCLTNILCKFIKLNLWIFFGLTFSIHALPKNILLNWKNPSFEDLRLVQQFLNEQFLKMPLDAYQNRTERIKSFKLFDPNYNSYQLHIKRGKDHSICITCYSSINANYQTKLDRLLKSLAEYDFAGDILYRIGGWPDMENGGILLCDTPYSFKISAFEEALRLGYKQVLWLDLSVVILSDLSSVFKKIKENRAYFRKSFFPFEKIDINEALAKACNMTLKELRQVPHYATGVLGLDLENFNVQKLLLDWHKFAEQKEAFKSNFPTQISFSILVDKYDFHKALCKFEEIVFSKDLITNDTHFFIQY